MMKQFLRVKQIADQKFQRSEKTSGVLTEELNAVEKQVDLIKESCYATGKKLSSCMQRLTPDASERRNNVKKIPETALAQCMEEWGLSLGENSILGMTLVDHARIQETLANDLLTYTLHVEENVVEPLQNILNVDITKIMKYRKQLFKLTSEMDSAKTRYQNSQRSSQQATGSGAIAATAKTQLLKEETEDIISRVDQCRDSLTAEMFNLLSREPEMSQIFVRLCQLQLEYHRKAFFMLESALPELEAQINCCAYQPVFGVPLDNHLKVTKREIATVIETCVCWLLDSAMEEEGLFRIGGSIIKIKKMKSAFDAGFQHLIDDEKDPHNVAGVLKLYLRSLPNPLLTYDLYENWMDAAMEPDHDSRLRSLWSVVNSLPETHFKNLRYLIKFLSKLCQNSDVNKMSTQNVAIVIGPNLLWPPVEDTVLGMNMTATNLHSSIVDTLITYSDWFFPGECEFYVSTPTSPRHIDGFPQHLMYGSQMSLSTGKLSNGDSAVESMSSSPTNSSPKSPSPRAPVRPRKKAAPKAPQSLKNPITRSVSCSGFQASVLARANAAMHQGNRLAALSVSHENLLNAGYGDGVFKEEQEKSSKDNNANHMHLQQTAAIVERPPRPKPPRHHQNGLPPVMERSRRSVERPSVPPPERPDSFCKTESVSSEDTPEKALDPEDISISFDSSSSESYNECQMSFADDSDNETTRPMEEHWIEKTVSTHNQLLGSPDLSMAKDTKEVLNDQISKPKSTDCPKVTENLLCNEEHKNYHNELILDERSNDSNIAKELILNEEHHNVHDGLLPENKSDGCHFTGGTPTWFDHYGDDKRQSNTLWFSDNEVNDVNGFLAEHDRNNQNVSNRLTSIEEDVPSDFRTIIEVGTACDKVPPSCKNTVSGIAIKLRVNSETHDTRL